MSNFKIVKLIDPIQLNLQGGLNFKGDYDNATAYVLGDAVTYGGSSYVALQNTTGNLPTDTDYWQIIAEKGDPMVVNGLSGASITLDPDDLDDTTTDHKFVTAIDLTNLSNLSGVNSGDDAPNATSDAYADGKVADGINNGTTTIAPSQNAVFDALALKADVSSLGSYVLKAGDTMAGNLNMGTNKLIGGTTVTDILKLQGTTGNGTATSPAIQLLTGNNGGTTALTVYNDGNALFGTNSSSLTSTPLNVSFGGTYGDSTPGSVDNLKWDMFNSGTGNRYGIGMSSALMEFQAGLNGKHAFFVNQGTEALRITNLGRVGIGTSTPASLLHVNGSGGTARLRITNTDGATGQSGMELYTGSTFKGGLFHQPSTDRIQLWDATAERVSLLQGGNVGVGTTAPATNLHVSSASGLTGTSPTEIRVGTTTNSSAWDTTLDWGKLSFYSADASSGGAKNHAEIATSSTSTGGGVSDLIFRTANSSGVLTEKLRLGASATNTLTGTNYAVASANNVVALYAQAAPSAISDIMRVVDSSGTILSKFDSAGRLVVNQNSSAVAPSALTVRGSNSAPTLVDTNLVTADVAFDTNTGWTEGAGWTIGSGVATHATGNTGVLSGTTTATSTSTVYAITFDEVETTAGDGFYVTLGGVSSGTIPAGSGTQTVYIRPANTTGNVGFVPNALGTWVGTIDNVSVKALTTSTADVTLYSSTTTSHPIEFRQGGGALSSVYMGLLAGSNNYTGASGNTAVGYTAMRYNTTGSSNTALGSASLVSNTSGIQNTAIGAQALTGNTIGSYNNAVGNQSLYALTSGTYNNAMGYRALYSITTGNNNIAIGNSAGRYHTSTSSLTSAEAGVFLGFNTRASGNGNTNEIVIGSNAIGNGSNSVTLGHTDITKTILNGNVGIGTTSPTAKLDVDSDTVRVRTAKTPASATATGNAGDICWDSNYVYVCVATNTWKRSALATW